MPSPMHSDSLILAHTTCGSPEEAEQLAARLVEEHLVACAAIGPAQLSIYPWQGNIEREHEIPLTLKTTADRFEALETRLCELHSYDVPELLATQVVESGHEYERWVRDWVTRQDN
ncbi:MAG: divalent-cation tolerance protein CutA [Wenzhouxiangellaceae bacterium]